jgi:hypothetical protein
MSKYRTWIDQRAAKTRAELSKLQIKDLGAGTMRWCLHLSDLEMAYLERNNPDTLGCLTDPAVYKAEWAKFVQHPESRPFKVQVGS